MAAVSTGKSDVLTLFPNNIDWSIQTLRLIAQEMYGGSEANEVYRAAQSIQEDTTSAWVDAWANLARRTRATAESAKARGHLVTAREGYFRSSNYYRHAEFYLPGQDSRKIELYNEQRKAFRSAAELAQPPIETIQVPFEGETLDGYFCHPVGGSQEKKPAVIFLGGADSLAEELYFFGGRAIVERGIFLCMVDTPGRGSAIRLKGIHSRPDYEVPVKAVIDYVASRPEVDPTRVALLGVSMGGYYAPRAAAYDKRIKALACWCACYNVYEDIYKYYPPIRKHLEWLTGEANQAAAIERLKEFSLAEAAPKITCPTLITHGESDNIIDPKAANTLHETIGGSSELRIWKASEGGAMHCNYDNFPAVVPFLADWLSDQLFKEA